MAAIAQHNDEDRPRAGISATSCPRGAYAFVVRVSQNGDYEKVRAPL